MNLKPPKEFRNGYKDPKRINDLHNIKCSLCYKLGRTQTTRTTAHHKHGEGLGLKTSDLLAISLCDEHHQNGDKAFHHLGRRAWEKEFNTTQEELLEITNELLENNE